MYVHMYCEDPSIFVSSVGYFVEPTILKTTDPKNKLMQEVTCYSYIASYSYTFNVCLSVRRYLDPL